MITLGILDGISDFFSTTIVQFILKFLSFIPKLMYFIVTCLLSIIDFFQVTFRKLAGMDPVIIGNEATQSDSVYQIISDAIVTGKYPAINTVFWSLIILGIFMLIVTSIVAVIRTEYKPDKEKGNSKAGIVKNFLTALFTFAIVPIASLFGMYLANQLVIIVNNVTAQATIDDESYTYFDTWSNDSSGDMVLTNQTNTYAAFDIFGITIPTTAQPFSGMVFRASAYSCNRFRLYGDDYLAQVNASSTNLGIFSSGTITEASVAADIIDTGFSINAKLKGASSGTNYSVDTQNISNDYYQTWYGFFGSTKDLTHFSKYNVEFVWYFYNLWTFNYIIGFVAVILISKLYLQFCLTLMSRIFEIVGLYVFAPIPISLMPLDNSASLDRWRREFIVRFSLVIFMVFGMNLINPVINVVSDIKLFNTPILDYIVSTFFIVAGLNAVQSISKMLTGIIIEKGGDSFEGALKSSSDALNSTAQGLQATRSAFNVGAMPARLVGRGAVATVGSGIGYAIRRGSENRQERRETQHQQQLQNFQQQEDAATAAKRAGIATNMQYGTAEQQAYRNNYNSMSAADRGAIADDFFETEEGREFVRKKYAGSQTAARNAIVNNTSRFTQQQKNDFLKFMHTRDVFNNTTDGSQLTQGTAEYRSALDTFNSMSTNERIDHETQRAPLTAAQQNVRQQREAYERQYQRRAERRAIPARVVGTARDRVIRPVFGSAERDMQQLLNLIHGRNLFTRPPRGGGGGGH